MTLIDAFGMIFGFLGAVFTSPAFFTIVGILLIAAGIVLFSSAFVGYGLREYVVAAFVQVGGVLGIITGIALIMWATSSASPTEWVAY